MYKKKLIIDIDGTICEEVPVFSKSLVQPIEGAVRCINKLHKEGFFIILYTSRGWAEYDMTKNWLNTYNIEYDVLLCGKPLYDVWIDDKAIALSDWENIEYAIRSKTS